MGRIWLDGWMNKAMIVDLDGTLFDIGHRLHHIEKEPKDWGGFNKGILGDEFNGWCLSIIEGVHWYYEYDGDLWDIIFVTGRMGTPEIVRDTKKSIENHPLMPPYEIFFRKDGDYRADDVVKREIYESEIKGKWEVVFVIDDRRRVVDMWREMGLVCLQCAKGDF